MKYEIEVKKRHIYIHICIYVCIYIYFLVHVNTEVLIEIRRCRQKEILEVKHIKNKLIILQRVFLPFIYDLPEIPGCEIMKHKTCKIIYFLS